MSASPSIRTTDACVERATSFAATAQTLRDAEDEWFAVCYFYSAYHLVKAALIADPVFDSLPRLTAIDGRITLEDRYMQRHKGRISGRDRTLGLNDLVTKLYPKISIEYRRLHVASIAVRYGTGLGPIKSEFVESDFARIQDHYTRGLLLAADPE